MIGPQKGLSIYTLCIKQSICEVTSLPRSPVQGLVLNLLLNFVKNLDFPVRTMWNSEFWVDIHKSTEIHRNFIIFRCACNAWTITTRKNYFQWKSSYFQVLTMVLPIIMKPRSISYRNIKKFSRFRDTRKNQNSSNRFRCVGCRVVENLLIENPIEPI